MDNLKRFDKQKYKKTWEKEHNDLIQVSVTKEKQFKERIKLLSIGLNKSQNQLLIEAIEDLLNKYNA